METLRITTHNAVLYQVIDGQTQDHLDPSLKMYTVFSNAAKDKVNCTEVAGTFKKDAFGKTVYDVMPVANDSQGSEGDLMLMVGDDNGPFTKSMLRNTATFIGDSNIERIAVGEFDWEETQIVLRDLNYYTSITVDEGAGQGGPTPIPATTLTLPAAATLAGENFPVTITNFDAARTYTFNLQNGLSLVSQAGANVVLNALAFPDTEAATKTLNFSVGVTEAGKDPITTAFTTVAKGTPPVVLPAVPAFSVEIVSPAPFKAGLSNDYIITCIPNTNGVSYTIPSGTGYTTTQLTPTQIGIRFDAFTATSTVPTKTFTFDVIGSKAGHTDTVVQGSMTVEGIAPVMLPQDPPIVVTPATMEEEATATGIVTPVVGVVHSVNISAGITLLTSPDASGTFTFEAAALGALEENDVTITVTASKDGSLNSSTTKVVKVTKKAVTPPGPVGDDFTMVGGEADIDLMKTDISQDLINVNDALVIQFNDSVDIATFIAGRVAANEANTLSVRYLYKDENGVDVTSLEVPANAAWNDTQAFSGNVWDWKAKTSPPTDAYVAGEFAFITTDVENDTLVLTPPTTGWVPGFSVRIELDGSLADTAGNSLLSGKDQVVLFRVASASEMVFTTPESEVSYFPYTDDTPENFKLTTGGVVTDAQGTGRVNTIKVKLTATDGTILSVEIPGSDEAFTTTTPEGHEITFTPNTENGGDFSVTFQLPHDQADQKYKWVASGSAVSAAGSDTAATNTKTLYHEIYENRILMESITIGGKDAIDGTVNFRVSDLSASGNLTAALSCKVQGDFFTDVKLSYKNTYVGTDLVDLVNVVKDQSPTVTEGTEEANVTGDATFVIGSDASKDDASYLFTVYATTKAGSVLEFPVVLNIDTIALNTIATRVIPMP